MPCKGDFSWYEGLRVPIELKHKKYYPNDQFLFLNFLYYSIKSDSTYCIESCATLERMQIISSATKEPINVYNYSKTEMIKISMV